MQAMGTWSQGRLYLAGRLILILPVVRLIRKVQAFPHTLAKKVLSNHGEGSQQHPRSIWRLCAAFLASSAYPILLSFYEIRP